MKNKINNIQGWNPLRDGWKNRIKARVRNQRTFIDYITRLEELYINMWEWQNLPDTVDARYLELVLCEYGYALYFNDETIGNLALTCMIGGNLNVYRIPTFRRAYATNGYQRSCTDKDSVLIFNNYLHTPAMETLVLYAERLTNIERAIEVNVNAQKTPVLIKCSESQKLSMKNVYEQWNGNEPVIYASKGLNPSDIDVLRTDAPYVANDLYTLKRQTLNEALTFCGVDNANTEKKERLVSTEVSSSLGAVKAQRYIALNARRQAAEQINKMFGTNIEVNFRQEFDVFNPDGTTTLDETPKLVEPPQQNGGEY